MPEPGPETVISALKGAGYSGKEARRLLGSGAVRMGGEVIRDAAAPVVGTVLVGKRPLARRDALRTTVEERERRIVHLCARCGGSGALAVVRGRVEWNRCPECAGTGGAVCRGGE